MLPSKFGVKWLLGLGEEAKNRFSRWLPWRPSWISDRHDYSYFYLQVTPMLPSKFGVKWPFGSGEVVKIDFENGCHGGHLGFPIGTILAFFFFFFFIYKSPQCFLASLESIGFSVQEKKRKIDFQDGGQSGHLGFPILTILAIFDLQVTQMLPIKYRVNWPRGVEGVGF